MSREYVVFNCGVVLGSLEKKEASNQKWISSRVDTLNVSFETNDSMEPNSTIVLIRSLTSREFMKLQLVRQLSLCIVFSI